MLKVKSIIKETVKSQSIKKESLMFDHSLIECELTSDAFDNRPSVSQSSSKRSRQPKHHEGRNFTASHHGNPKFRGNPRQNFAQSKGYFCSNRFKAL